MQVVILCGGKGTRLYPLTKKIPKSMVEIFFTKPFIYYQLMLLKHQGINNIVLCTGVMGDQIEKYIVDNEYFNMNIKFSRETEPLGTGGALYNAKHLLDETFSIMYGDSYLTTNLFDLQQLYKGDSPLMAIYRNTCKLYTNNVYRLNDKLVYDKECTTGEYIDYGFISMHKSSVLDTNELTFEHLDFIEVYESFYEIGSIEGLRRFKSYIWRTGLC